MCTVSWTQLVMTEQLKQAGQYSSAEWMTP